MVMRVNSAFTWNTSSDAQENLNLRGKVMQTNTEVSQCDSQVLKLNTAYHQINTQRITCTLPHLE